MRLFLFTVLTALFAFGCGCVDAPAAAAGNIAVKAFYKSADAVFAKEVEKINDDMEYIAQMEQINFVSVSDIDEKNKLNNIDLKHLISEATKRNHIVSNSRERVW